MLRRAGPWLLLALLLLHARRYDFLCDDAFISFRYARNLSHGLGLVFNPGLERVEGYTNFLWVVLLAVSNRLGVEPGLASMLLSMGATIGLWFALSSFVRRDARTPVAWTLVPVGLLAITRSVAVWTTGGLETRLFECLVVAGVLRAIVEIESLLAARTLLPTSGWLFGFAVLTRPDAWVIALPVLLLAAWQVRAVSGARAWGLRTFLPLLALSGAHTAFRLAYYGEWLPNTYYAKVAGRMRWDWGSRYLYAWALEYGVGIWIPAVFLGVRAWFKTGRASAAVILIGALTAWLIYVASIGGDHFEYRALGIVFPLSFILLSAGLQSLAAGSRGRMAAWALLVGIAAGLLCLPLYSRAGWPQRYLSGFPGASGSGEAAREDYLSPDLNGLGGIPVVGAVAREHQRITRELTARFVAIRQEEHARFSKLAIVQGQRLRALVQSGVIPHDVRIAVDCVGAVPFVSDLAVLDRHGLTDAGVARRHEPVLERMAHEKVADMDDARRFGVELWAEDPFQLVLPLSSPRILFAMTHPGGEWPVYAAFVGDRELVLARMPRGLEAVRVRTPRLDWRSVADTAFAQEYVRRATPVISAQLLATPDDPDALNVLAFLLLVQGRLSEALARYQQLAEHRPDDPIVWERVVDCAQRLAQVEDERLALLQLLRLAQERRDETTAAGIQMRLQAIERMPPGSR